MVRICINVYRDGSSLFLFTSFEAIPMVIQDDFMKVVELKYVPRYEE